MKSLFLETWEIYMRCWSETNHVIRNQLMEQVLIIDCTDTDAYSHVEGREQLSDYMDDFQKKVEGIKFIATHFVAHHNQSLAHWDMLDGNGNLITKGASFAMYDKDGRLTQMNSFRL